MYTSSDNSNNLTLMPRARFELDQRRALSNCPEVWQLLDQVKDPEIPVLSLWDLGVLQEVQLIEEQQNTKVRIVITPTYSGCPAVQQMCDDLKSVLQQNGFGDVEITLKLSPAWTTEWLSTATRKRLLNYGIAPPDELVCPQCGSEQVSVISDYGSTACKALYRCGQCGEPFDYFKPL